VFSKTKLQPSPHHNYQAALLKSKIKFTSDKKILQEISVALAFW